jgi:hypothetical protein
MAERERDVAAIEQTLKDLQGLAAETARELADCDAVIAQARETMQRAQAELPLAEREAKERRRARHESVRGRAELEHRLATLVEAEELCRARREQAEARAQGLRGAASFATISATEAEARGDHVRAERERLVAERALRECASAEARAADERAEERRLRALRTDVDVHVVAEAELERTLAIARLEAEARVGEMRLKLESASGALYEAEARRALLADEAAEIEREAAKARRVLDDATRMARSAVEARIATLQRIELEAAAERIELEAQLSVIASAEARVAAAAREVEFALELEQAAREEAAAHVTEAYAREAHHDETSLAEVAAAETHALDVRADAADASEAPAPIAAAPFASNTPLRPAPGASETSPFPISIAAPLGGGAVKIEEDELIPGLRGLFDSLTGRRRSNAEPAGEESTSVADRIARDFGLLGDRPESAAS